MDVSIALTRAIPFLPPSLLQQQRKVSAPRYRESRQQRILCVPLYVSVPDREPDFLTDSHVTLDILVDTQEPFNTSHHRVAFDYDEDTVSLVEEQTLSTLDILLSNNFYSSAGNASTAFEYECYEIEDDAP